MLRQLISYPNFFFRSLDLRSQISRRIMWIISKSYREKKNFLIFFQSIHQVDMKTLSNESKTFFPILRLYIPTVISQLMKIDNSVFFCNSKSNATLLEMFHRSINGQAFFEDYIPNFFSFFSEIFSLFTIVNFPNE